MSGQKGAGAHHTSDVSAGAFGRSCCTSDVCYATVVHIHSVELTFKHEQHHVQDSNA